MVRQRRAARSQACRVARQAAATTHVVASAAAVPSPAAVVPIAAAPADMIDPAKHPGVVTSPMVGTAYRASEPTARPFVDIGSTVKAGDPLLVVEAMKVMNQIQAPRGGTVMQILFENAQPVEFGQPLMIIE